MSKTVFSNTNQPKRSKTLYDQKSNNTFSEQIKSMPKSIKQRAGKDFWKKALENKKRFKTLVNSSEKELYRAKAVFPFDFFPDEISVESTQVNLIDKQFFYTETVHSLPIKNITDVILDMSPFFGSLTLVDISYVQNTISISHLKKSEAKRARRIIQGLMILSKENIDLSRYNSRDLLSKVEELGTAKAIE